MSEYLYELKPSLITRAEKPYLTAIKRSLPNGYFVQPQVNLASIITKTGNHRFQNELYRNVDACVFDMNYAPILLIEINDNTHNDRNRKERDEKVKNICEDAGIQLITLWTRYGVNEDYIFKRVNDALQNAATYRIMGRKAHFNDTHDLTDEKIDEILNRAQVINATNYSQAPLQSPQVNCENRFYDDRPYRKPKKPSAIEDKIIRVVLVTIILCISFVIYYMFCS